ncbi:ABC transporter permease [Aestuariivirga sp.]|uniref:ABC transporter permease n=1 Tax=Aestuariivirga sp. TaxID=2650926 RepID=UPI0039E3E831
MSIEYTPQPRLGLMTRLIGLLLALGLTAGGVVLGFQQSLPVQYIILSAVATLALSVWVWRFLAVQFQASEAIAGAVPQPSEARAAWAQHKLAIIGFLIFAALFAILSITVDGFFNIYSIISALILIAIIVLTVKFSRYMAENRSSFIGLMVLAGLFSVGSMTIEGFASLDNVKSMLVFAAFLGLACVGQTLVALLGGLDLSIPFVIGGANVLLLYIIGLGVPPWLAFILIILGGALVGLINGILSYRLQGQALIVTLGVGFAVSGGTQIITSLGSAYSGNVFGVVPPWLSNIAAMNGTTFGMNFPAVIAIWAVVAIVLIFGLNYTVYGRYLYALGVNRVSASRVNISERAYWFWAYIISGAFSAFTGSLLLGWSGGGFIGVGDPYLFMTIAAVVVGGTSLLGGNGGYGFTVIGVLVLQVLTSFLVGLGLEFEWQQFIFGLLILPMVALYARSPHIRTQI